MTTLGPAATGIGSLPGIDYRAAVRSVLDELPEMLHLPELPARGPHAAMVVRTAALLPDLHVDHQPSGWRLVPRRGLDERRAVQTLTDDIDVLATEAAGYEGVLKAQLCGPVTMGAALELTRAGRAINDAAAMTDIGGAMIEAVMAHLAALRASIPLAQFVVQIDEPALTAAIGGLIPRESGYGKYRPVDQQFAEALIRDVVTAIHAAGATAVVHCCAPTVPIGLLRRTGIDALSLDVTLLTERDDEELAEAVDQGLGLWFGAVGSTAPLSVEAATLVRHTASRLGVGPDALAHTVVVTPTCGLAGATAPYAVAAMRAARTAVRQLAETDAEEMR
ncbi:MAG: methionine synthase [Frankiales bacterium]|nr:methionine synthase [Frankiales bacterium]